MIALIEKETNVLKDRYRTDFHLVEKSNDRLQGNFF